MKLNDVKKDRDEKHANMWVDILPVRPSYQDLNLMLE